MSKRYMISYNKQVLKIVFIIGNGNVIIMIIKVIRNEKLIFFYFLYTRRINTV